MKSLHFNIRTKLFISYSCAFLVLLLGFGLGIYFFVRHTIESNIESQLEQSTDNLLSLVETATEVSLKNYLRATAEKSLAIVGFYHNLAVRGELTEEQARKRVAEILLDQHIGESGYIYIINSAGVLQVHPEPSLVGVDISGYDFVGQQKEHKNGYLVYDWQNPGEANKRGKALYMSYFEPWDWVISVSTYRNEFLQLVKLDDFREKILSLSFGQTGYSYVMDLAGNLIIHPQLEGHNILGEKDAKGRFFIREICNRKTGKIIYPWQNPGDPEPREKLVIFKYIPQFQWIVASSSYLNEFFAPLNTLRRVMTLAIAAALLLLVPVTLAISSTITAPLKELMAHLARTPDGDFTARITHAYGGEIGRLADYFNRFMARLERYSNDLKKLQERILDIGETERRKIGQDIHDDLCPHLIGTEVMAKILQRRLEKELPAAAKPAEKIRLLIKEAIRKSRGMARGLCPVFCVDRGLEVAIEELVANTEDVHGIPCSYDHRDLLVFKDNTDPTQIFLIVQEAITNVVRHAEASGIVIRQEPDSDGRVSIVIEDDGKGITKPPGRGGMGLKIMSYRAERIGADLTVQPGDRRGTRVVLTLSDVAIGEESDR